jgi:AcrR family transcriptional regulator
MSSCGMAKKTTTPQRRPDSLSKDRIVEAAITLLDDHGESGLTFRALAERLSTGAGAIYWHIANKTELLTAACDAILSRTIKAPAPGAASAEAIRALALNLFEAIDVHPWIGSALTQAPRQLPMVRILEALGQQIRALGVPDKNQWASVGALLNYVLGVGGRNAANGQLARAHGLDRSDFLESVAVAWSQLDPDTFPFTRSLAKQVRSHDDRADFLAGIDFILAGISSQDNGEAI